ncbi:MAG TPA: tRNA 2-selenouridine(34) synthase MnmH [Bacteroidales bacterium]|nr:tRNA 2-selenouridine(34) synthase MnmH [Bacteroidales bacterium]
MYFLNIKLVFVKSIEPNELLNHLEDNPLVDVRTPAEFAAGHIPGAINIPLFSNEERAEVGTLYKQVSRHDAMLCALDIVGPKMSGFVKLASELSFKDYIIVHCWRGGMRSSTFAWLLNTAGINAVTVKDGYKGFRRYSASYLNKDWKYKVLTACTGSGKTELLWSIKDLGEQIVDLEELANHKGSVFGGLGHIAQPTTEQFENNLFWTMKDFDINKTVWLEDESKCIGHVFIPEEFYSKMHFSPLVKIGIPFEERVARLVNEYAQFSNEELAYGISKITKRLGGDNAKNALAALEKGNYGEVARILLWYYDKAYTRSVEERRKLIEYEKEFSSFNTNIIVRDILTVLNG